MTPVLAGVIGIAAMFLAIAFIFTTCSFTCFIYVHVVF